MRGSRTSRYRDPTRELLLTIGGMPLVYWTPACDPRGPRRDFAACCEAALGESWLSPEEPAKPTADPDVMDFLVGFFSRAS